MGTCAGTTPHRDHPGGVLTAIETALLVLGLPFGLLALYLLALTLLSGRRSPPRGAAPDLRFDLVVPAHDEEAHLAETLASLRALDWPEVNRRIVVVADNCSDRTAEVAAASGAYVLVRDDPARRGKGYALDLAFYWCRSDAFADAVVVVDADTVVDPGLLRAFAARLAQGAGAVQAYYSVRNPEAGWRTRLMAIAFAAFHRVRSLGRERLGLSCGLRGNGMCLSTTLLAEVPPQAYSVVEDVEFGLQLGEAGHRVCYADDAQVFGQMVAGAQASVSQRRRWEGGRWALARRWVPRLLRGALRQRDRVQLDLAVDLLVPPLAQLGAGIALGTLTSLIAWLAGGSLFVPGLWLASLACLVAYVGRGWQLSGTGLAGLGALAHAPLYLAWKLLARASRPPAAANWVRTTREVR